VGLLNKGRPSILPKRELGDDHIRASSWESLHHSNSIMDVINGGVELV
jgi:hypothetical protein